VVKPAVSSSEAKTAREKEHRSFPQDMDTLPRCSRVPPYNLLLKQASDFMH
jgi:hypothetical protein